jgi:hypothetical protein
MAYKRFFTSKDLIKEVIELTQAGHIVDPARSRQIGFSHYNLFYTEVEPEVVEDTEVGLVDDTVESVEVNLDELTKKDDLLEYAVSKSIEVPSDKTQPAAIKKFLKEQLSG